MDIKDNYHHKITAAGILVSLGIIYGDIGTSPLYVFSSIIGERLISEDLVLGGASCVFWTLTLITSIKYIYLALNADNKGEGGIFALYALVRKYKANWLIYAAMIGCCTLIADGFLTPAYSISSAVEGLIILYPSIPTMPIVIIILILLFFFQQFGTSLVGKTFGPIMMIWFVMKVSGHCSGDVYVDGIFVDDCVIVDEAPHEATPVTGDAPKTRRWVQLLPDVPVPHFTFPQAPYRLLSP